MVNLDHAATGVAHSSLMNNMMSFDQWFYSTTEPGVRRVFDIFEKYGPPLGPTVQTLGGVAGLAGAILGTVASGPFSWATALSLGGIAGASIDQIETGLYGVYKGYTQPSNLRTASGLVGFSETSQDRIEFARDLASGGKEALTKGIHLFGLLKPSTLKLARKGAGSGNNVADALRLKTTLRLQEAGILDHSGYLTKSAIDRSVVIMDDGSVFNNKSVIERLPKMAAAFQIGKSFQQSQLQCLRANASKYIFIEIKLLELLITFILILKLKIQSIFFQKEFRSKSLQSDHRIIDNK